MMNTNLIRHAEDKQYTDFERGIKKELFSKLSSHPVITDYKREYDKINAMKDKFKDINEP